MNLRADRPPEIDLAVLGFLLNAVWELVQCPLFYADVHDAGLVSGTLMCLRAAVGDVNILLAAFWGTALVSDRHRKWLFEPRWAELMTFLAIGIGVTVVFELLATQVWHRWAYSDAMPVIFGIGVAPLLQWLVLPPVVLYLAGRTSRVIVWPRSEGHRTAGNA